MMLSWQSDRLRWLIAAVSGVLLVGSVLLVLRTISVDPPARPPSSLRPPARIGLTEPARVDRALEERAAMNDLRPLFLPTPRNAQLRPLPLREPGETFVQPPRFLYPDLDAPVGARMPPLATLAGRRLSEADPVDALSLDAFLPLAAGFARDGAEVPLTPPRGAAVEVFSARTGARVLSALLPASARPAVPRPWQPLELLAGVDPAGLAVPLLIAAGSGAEEVDLHFKNYLSRDFRLGDRLLPGFYRVVVAP
jgi:hypothetical protein